MPMQAEMRCVDEPCDGPVRRRPGTSGASVERRGFAPLTSALRGSWASGDTWPGAPLRGAGNRCSAERASPHQDRRRQRCAHPTPRSYVEPVWRRRSSAAGEADPGGSVWSRRRFEPLTSAVRGNRCGDEIGQPHGAGSNPFPRDLGTDGASASGTRLAPYVQSAPMYSADGRTSGTRGSGFPSEGP
jgi:hypothetical protein